MMRNAAIYILAVFICLASGYMAGLLQATALEEWYPTLAKSSLTPPNLIFPIAWGILYVCIGVSLGETIRCGNIRAIAPWVLQLIANFLWTVFFFWLRNPLLALIDILLLDVLVIWYIVAASRGTRLSMWLFVPYLLWLLLATYLNLYVCMHNTF